MNTRKENIVAIGQSIGLAIAFLLLFAYPCLAQTSPSCPQPGEKLYVFEKPNSHLLALNLAGVQMSGLDTTQTVVIGNRGNNPDETVFLIDKKGRTYIVPARDPYK